MDTFFLQKVVYKGDKGLDLRVKHLPCTSLLSTLLLRKMKSTACCQEHSSEEKTTGVHCSFYNAWKPSMLVLKPWDVSQVLQEPEMWSCLQSSSWMKKCHFCFIILITVERYVTKDRQLNFVFRWKHLYVNTPVNTLNLKIKIWTLICCPYSFPTEAVVRELIKHQANSSSDHVCNSHDHSSLQRNNITRRSLMLITFRA